MWQNGSSSLGKFQIIIWNFPNSELQETHFHVFYQFTNLFIFVIASQTIVRNRNSHHQQLLRDVFEEWFSIPREMWAFSYNSLMGRVSVNRVSATFRVIHPCRNWLFAKNFLARRFGENGIFSIIHLMIVIHET